MNRITLCRILICCLFNHNQPYSLFMEKYRIVIDVGVYILTFIVVEWLLFLPGMGGVSCEGRPDHQLAWMEQQAD